MDFKTINIFNNTNNLFDYIDKIDDNNVNTIFERILILS